MSVYRYRMVFKRTDRAKGLSHREQIKFFRELFSRELPVALFEKKMRIAFGPAVSVGHESLCEYVDVYLEKRMEQGEFLEALSGAGNGGFELSRVSSIPVFFPSIEKSVELTEYEIFLGSEDRLLGARMEESLKKSEIIHRKQKENGEIRTKDLKKYVFSWKTGEGSRSVTLFLRHIGGTSVKPETVLAEVGGYSGPVEKILRKGMYWIDSKGELVAL